MAYPDVSLRDARERRDDARKLIASGIDQSERKQAEKRSALKAAGDSFEAIAREWLTRRGKQWTPAHGRRQQRRLERDLFPWLGPRPISAIDAGDLLDALRRVEERGAIETAHRLRSLASQIFAYAISTRRAMRNPAADLTGDALQRSKPTHRAAITDQARSAASYVRSMPIRIQLPVRSASRRFFSCGLVSCAMGMVGDRP